MSFEIPTDESAYRKLIGKIGLFYLRSMQEDTDEFDRLRDLEDWWDQVKLDEQEEEEYAIRLGLGFSLVESMHAKITEPLFQMGLPCDTYPRKFGHYGAAQNMQQIQRNYYSNPNFQEGLGRSKKSMCLVGHRWEFDGFLNVERKGKRWGMVDAKVEVPLKRRTDGTPDASSGTAKDVVKVLAEIPIQRKVHYGFHTEFPRWDQVHPEAGKTTIDTGEKTDMTRIMRSLGALTIEDLAREVRYDPNSKTTVPLYDFGKMLHHYGKAAEERYRRIMDGDSGSSDQYGAIITPEFDWDNQMYGRRGTTRKTEASALEDRDKIAVHQYREMNEIVTVAQCKWVILRQVDPWQVPGLKARIENYTTPHRRLRGPGAIEPARGILGEIEDMHGLSMQNIFRIVNKMTYVRDDALVTEDDFDPRAGGLVRIKSDVVDVRGAVLEGNQQSPVNEMRVVESDLRSLIEKISSDLDSGRPLKDSGSGKKTATEVESVINNLSPIYARFQRQARINECRRCANMGDILEQFHFDKVPYQIWTPDGTTAYGEFDRTDIDTEGLGLSYRFQMDPMWGNPQQRLAMKRQTYEAGLKHNSIPPQQRGPNPKEVNLSKLFQDMLEEGSYGKDVSEIFAPASGEMEPDQEMSILAQGGVVSGCRGDLLHHVQMHLLQAQSPGLAAMMKSGKAAPDTQKKLQLLVEQAMNAIKTFISDPSAAATQKLNQSGFQQPGEQPRPTPQ